MTAAVPPCRRCESPLERDDLRCAVCGLSADAPARNGLETLEVSVLRCDGCGAAVSYDAATQAPRCAFCDSVMQVETLVDPMEQTEHSLPFTVEAEEAAGALRQWLGNLGWFRPSDLKAQARVTTLRPLYWVAWLFDAEALISWTADSDAGAQRSAWAPHAGQVDMTFDDIIVSASRGLGDAEVQRLAGSYDLRLAQPEPPTPDRPTGAVVEQFDVQRSMARRRILEGIRRTASARVQANEIPGRTFRNVHTVALLRRLVTRRYALPAWVLAYRYKSKLYRVVISGHDARCIRGAAPTSAAKVILVIVLALAGIALIVAIGIALAAA